MTGRVHDLIMDPKRTGELTDVIAEGEYYGMQTFDQALYEAVSAGTRLAWRTRCTTPRGPTTSSCWSSAEGHLHTTMEDLQQRPATGAPGLRPGPVVA